MLQGFEDGVYMDNSVYIVDEKKQGTPFLLRIVQLLMILFGTWSSIEMLAGALEIPCNYFEINLAVLIISAILYGLFLLPSYDLVKLFIGVLFYGLFLYSRGERLLNGFYILENLTLKQIDSYYEVETIRFVADYTTKVADTTLLLIMMVIPFAVLLALTVLRNRLPVLSGVLLLIPVAANFALGFVPAERYLVCYAICTTYLISQTHGLRYTTDRNQQRLLHKISSRTAVWLCLLGLFLFFAMKLLVTKEEYEGMPRLKEAQSQMQTAIRDFSTEDFLDRLSEIELFTRKVSSTGLDGGRLGTAAQVRYTNKEHLRVVAPVSSIEEGIYLKGYVGSIYEGDRWTGHSKETEIKYEELKNRVPEEIFQPVNQVPQFLRRLFVDTTGELAGSDDLNYSMKEGHMEIRYLTANKQFLYTPYFTDYAQLQDIYFDRDLYAAPEAPGSRYGLDYYYKVAGTENVVLQGGLSKLEANGYTGYEKAYRDFVYQAYTVLPAEGLKNIKRDFSAERVKTKTGSVAEKIEYVRKYLEENTSYSLSPGKLPEGKDFVEYFLYENKVGYCEHYASAATLMLRAMGIPARYVEGYAFGKEAIDNSSGVGEVTRYSAEGSKVNMEAFSEASVRDYNAHAWVEVYFDYCGWYPVEFTPGAPVNYNQSVIADVDRMGTAIYDEELRKDLSQPTIAPEIPEQYQPIQDDRLNREYSSDTDSTGAGGSSSADRAWFMMIFTTLIVGIILLWAYLLWRGNRSRYTGSRNQRAFTFYRDIEKLLQLLKALPEKKMLLEDQEEYVKEHCEHISPRELDRLMELIRGARFGRRVITEAELTEIIWYRSALYSRARSSLPALKRIIMKILLAI